MPDLDKYFDEIDISRTQRVLELSNIKKMFGSEYTHDKSDISSKAVVVLAYANWEGFYNECARVYVNFLKERGGRICDGEWMFLVGALRPAFDSLFSQNHSRAAKREFVSKLKDKLNCGFDVIESEVIEARSNLDYKRLAENYDVLNFDIKPLQVIRQRLDKQVVAWRHLVAHGDVPDLTDLDIASHVSFVADLLLLIADHFQEAMLERV